jgi:membrane protein
MSSKKVIGLFQETYEEWSEDKAPRLGAALAYYSIFSIAPLLILVIAAAGMLFGKEAAGGAVQDEIQNFLGLAAATAIEEMIQSAAQDGHSSLLATALAVGTLMLGAAGAFVALQDALNTIWKVPPPAKRRWWVLLKERLLSFGMVLIVGFLLLISLVINTVLTAAMKFIDPSSIPGGLLIWQGLNTVVSIIFITLLFALIFKILPDAPVAWSDVWAGAIVTSLLFTLGKYLIGLYLGQGSVSSAYGAAGSLVIILLWVYYSSQILLFGAEFTRVYAYRFGSHAPPALGSRFQPSSERFPHEQIAAR